eukprot:superscaffoldBa00008473_g23378
MTDAAGETERSGRGQAPGGDDTQLLQRTCLTKGILSCSVRQPSCDSSSSSISSLLLQNDQLKKTTGEVRDTPDDIITSCDAF